MEAVPEHRLSPDDRFDDAVRLFDQHHVEFLCVLDQDGLLHGVITRNELFEAFAQGKTAATTVRDFMRVDPVAVTPDDTSLMGGDLMNKQDLDWLPVVADKDSQRLVGVVRSERMLRHLVSHLSDGPESN
jgi:CBS domain-containing protein